MQALCRREQTIGAGVVTVTKGEPLPSGEAVRRGKDAGSSGNSGSKASILRPLSFQLSDKAEVHSSFDFSQKKATSRDVFRDLSSYSLKIFSYFLIIISPGNV